MDGAIEWEYKILIKINNLEIKSVYLMIYFYILFVPKIVFGHTHYDDQSASSWGFEGFVSFLIILIIIYFVDKKL